MICLLHRLARPGEAVSEIVSIARVLIVNTFICNTTLGKIVAEDLLLSTIVESDLFVETILCEWN